MLSSPKARQFGNSSRTRSSSLPRITKKFLWMESLCRRNRKRRRLSLINQPVVNRVERQFQAIRNAQLVENIVQVVLHRLLADEQFLADLAIAETLRHQLYDFFFAVTQ